MYEIIELHNYGLSNEPEETNIMDNFGNTTRLSTELNLVAHRLEISGVWLNPQGEEAGGVVNAAPKLLPKWLIICGGSSLAALRPSLCWAATAALPWDQTLLVFAGHAHQHLVAPAAIALAFSSAVVLYALGGHDKEAGRLVGAGIGGCIALGRSFSSNSSFPDSIQGRFRAAAFWRFT